MSTFKDIIEYVAWVVFVLIVLAFFMLFFEPKRSRQALSGERNYAIHCNGDAAS
jgi:hypothetical protein